MPMTPAERRARASAGGLASAARDPDRGRKMREARVDRFMREARELHPDVDEGTAEGQRTIAKVADLLERAHMAKMQFASLKARRLAKERKEREASTAEQADASG